MFGDLQKHLSATGTEINYFFVCKRKLWYSARQINCESEHHNVAMGNLLHTSAYNRKRKEYLFDKVKVDWLDLQRKIIHEVKKSDKIEKAHLWQLKYYLLYFKKQGIGEFSGELNYPLQKKKVKVEMEEGDQKFLENIILEIKDIKDLEIPPTFPKNQKICKKCAYYELCFS